MRAVLPLGLGVMCPALLLIPGFKAFLEASMYTHMLVLYPGLMASGFIVGRFFARCGAAKRYESIDAHGVLTIAAISALSAFWMVPIALDYAVLDPWMAALRNLSLLFIGLTLAWRMESLPKEMLIFLAGNAAWMLITAGALIGASESRLCVSYLYEDQKVTGFGLAAYGCLIGALAVARSISSTGPSEV